MGSRRPDLARLGLLRCRRDSPVVLAAVWRPRISVNKVGFWSLSVLVLWRGAGERLRTFSACVPWRKAVEEFYSAGSLNKRLGLRLGPVFLSLMLLSRHGGVGELGGSEFMVNGARSWEMKGAVSSHPSEAVISCANHMASSAAVIFGCFSGPSSTSTVEALIGARRRSSSARIPQVVRPRWIRAGRWIWFFADKKDSSVFSGLGAASASRPPASGGGEPQALDCFFIFCVEVLSGNCQPPFSNFRSFVQWIILGASCKMYPPVF